MSEKKLEGKVAVVTGGAWGLGRGYALRLAKLGADIAIIDTATFLPVADFENPTELSTGIRQLLINGEGAIIDGEITGELAGALINRRALDCR